MPPTTRSNGKPPPSRVYNTTPTLHQLQFPARRKVVKTYSKRKGTPISRAQSSEDEEIANPSSSKPTPAAASTKRHASKKFNARFDPRQKTLTQIDFVSSSFSESPNIAFSDSEEEKENDDPEEEDDDEEPVSSTKRRRAQGKCIQSKRRRTLGDQTDNERPKKDKKENRRRTLGDAPSASAYHTQTLTQFVGRDAMRTMIRDSEDEDEASFDDWVKEAEADSPTYKTKNNAPDQQSPGTAKSPAQRRVEPTTPAKNRTATSILEVPSSSQSATPLSNRMLARYGAPDSNKPSPSKGTQQQIITEAKGQPPKLVIQDSYSTASWESLPKVSPSKRTPSKGTPLKDITEEVVIGRDETPTKRASQRASHRAPQRSKWHAKTGKENETPVKAASQRNLRGTATPTSTKRKSQKELSSGKFEIPDSDEDDMDFTESEDELGPAIAPEESTGSIVADAVEQNALFGDPSEILGQQDSLIEDGRTLYNLEEPDSIEPGDQCTHVDKTPRRNEDASVRFRLPDSGPVETEQFTHLDKTHQDDQNATEDDLQLPETAATDVEGLFTHMSKTQQDRDSVPDYGFNSSTPPSSKGGDRLPEEASTDDAEQFTHLSKTQAGGSIVDLDFNSLAPSARKQGDAASYIDRTQHQESINAILPSSSAIQSEPLTHLDKTQQEESLPTYSFNSSAPPSMKRDEASYTDKSQHQESASTMLPPSSAGKSDQFTHLDKTPQAHDLPTNYDFEAFPTTSQASMQEEEEPYTHIDKTQHGEEVTPRAHVRFRSTPAIIPSPVQPAPTPTEDRVATTQESEGTTPFATAKEVAVETTEPETTESRELANQDNIIADGAGEDDYAGAETQSIWREIESSKEDPFQSTTSSRRRTSSAETPQTSPQLPPTKPTSALKAIKLKRLRKPLRTLPSSQSQPLESQRISLRKIQAMGQPTSRTDIILPVPSSSLAPLISGHTLHLDLQFKVPAQVERFWLFEDRALVRYSVCAEFEEDFLNANGERTWRYFVSQVFELNDTRTEETLLQDGYIWKKIDKYTYLDPGPVAQLLANLQRALFSNDGEDEPETQLSEIEEEPTQQEAEPNAQEEVLPDPQQPPTKKPTLNPDSSFSIFEAVEAQLLSEQANHTQPTDEILCPSTPLKERPSAPPPTNPIASDPRSPPRQTFVRPSQATTASQASTPEKQPPGPSQYLPPPTTTTPCRRAQARESITRRHFAPPESGSSNLTFPDSDSSPPFLIPLSQAGGLRSSQLLTKSQMLPDSLVRDDGEWEGSG